MQLTAALVAVLSFSAADGASLRLMENAFVQHTYRYSNSTSVVLHEHVRGINPYGYPGCQCIGIDNLDGTTTISSKDITYPADVGGSCSAWDKNSNPECKSGKAPSWCSKEWCYVDPCTCNLDVPAQPSQYMTEGKYQGKPIHYSYATCGFKDDFSSDVEKMDAQKADNRELCAKPHNEEFGDEKCKCIGIDGQEGVTEVKYKDEHYDYPADVGAKCNAWEKNTHPECKGAEAPDWCSQPWCYVDPCKCDLSTPSKHSAYLPDAKYQGKPIHYSYVTCKGTDSWSSDDMKKQAAKNEEICDKHGRVIVKSAARSATATAALALAGVGALLC